MIALRMWLASGWIVGSAVAVESFEALPAGALARGDSLYGKLSADAGHAEVLAGKGRSGVKALRIAGGADRSVILDFEAPTRELRTLDFRAERWTSRGGFEFHVEVKTQAGWSLLKRDDGMKVGGYHSHLQAELPVGASALRFVCSSAAGMLIDDLSLARSGPMAVLGVTTASPVVPVLRRKAVNPVLGFIITTEGNESPVELEVVELSLEGTTRPQDIERVEIIPGTGDPSGRFDEPVAGVKSISNPMILKPNRPLASGGNVFWVSVTLKDQADIDGRVAVSLRRVTAGGKTISPAAPAPAVSQRIGVALRLRGDDGSHSYRIPGMVRTRAGSLIAVYDIRHNGCGDLPAKIDVGASRSTDGGQTWEGMRVAMHPGTMGAKYEADGNGDAAILVDDRTGRIWLAAFWSHGNRGWQTSGPGLTPDETGQLLLSHSDDDGRTWSGLRNLTKSVKDPAWRLMFNGPGAGICMKDGTLVFPAQFRAADGGTTMGKPFSTILWSKDRGETWTIGSGAKIDTTEAQVAELADGSLMLNCRDNRGGSRTVMVTNDLGKTWTAHPTDRGALPESVCMASLLRWDHPKHGGLFFFSNPATTRGRHHMTLKLSRDDAMSWPEKCHVLYDARGGSGYSCLAPAGNDHVGILYEGPCELYYLRLPVDECLGAAEPARHRP